MAELYIHIPGGEQLSIVPEASSSQDWALMGDNKLSLSFQRYECLILPAGAWCEFDGVIFYLLQEYKPTMIHSHLWQYNVAFVDGASWLGVTTALKTIDEEDVPLFTLTAPAAEHAAIIVSNLNRRLGTTMWKVGSVIDTPNITIEYTGKYCGAVLQEIVDDQNTEWWVDGTTLNIGRAEFGSLIELGYRDGLLGDITVMQADNMSSYRTLYPVGSTRNILPTEYGHDRLQLPNGQKSVMMNPAGVAELVEEAAFAGIYPRYKGKVTGVSTSIGQSNDGSQYLIYIVADTAIPFNPNEYEMPGLVKHITFQSGELMGAEFEVNYNPASNEFELITQFQENGSQLPGGMLIPQVGDEYVVWNISMPAEYYPLAEQELLEAAESFAAASTRESNVYKVKLDYIDVQERGLSLRPGQKVRLHSLDYFPEQGYYDSRITRITRPVNYPGEYTIDVSAVRVVGSLTRLQTSLAAATTKVNSLSNTVQTVVQTVSNAVTLTGNQRVKGVKDFVDGVRVNGSPVIEYDPVINTWLFRGNILAEGGMAAFSNIKGFTPSTITDAVLIDNRTIKRGADGLMYVDLNEVGGGGTGGGSVDPSQLEAYFKPYAKTADVASTYATIASLSAVTSRLNDFLSGSDTDTIINKWSELETFLAGLTETDNLATILSGKANKATTLAGYGITDAYTKSHIDSNFVTIGTKQEITGEKDFVGGFKVNGGLVEYNATLKAWVLNGDLLVTGGVSAFSNISGFKPSTITDAVLIDDRTIKRNADGFLYAVAQGAGGINEDQLADYLTTYGYATQSWVTSNGYITASALEPYALKTAIPTKLSQLTDDVVSGKYLSIAGGTVNGAVTINHSGNTPLVINQNYGAVSNPRGVVVMSSTLSNSNLYISHLFGKEGSMRNSAWVGFYLDSAGSNNNRLSMGLYGVDNVLNILGSGNVAIGGTTASEKLEVHGNIKATSFIGNASSANRLVEEVVTDLNNATAGRIFTMTSGYGSTDGNKPTTGWVTGLTLQFAQNGFYRRQLAYSDDFFVRDENNGSWGDWRKILTSTNFYDYALPKDGTASAAWKLANVRYLWGQLFDGTSNIGGQMSFNAGSFILAHNATDAWTDGNGLTHPWYGIDFRAGGSYKGYISHWSGISLVSGNDITLATDKNVIVSNGKFRINQSTFSNGLTLNRTSANAGAGIVFQSNGNLLGQIGINGTKTFEVSDGTTIKASIEITTGNLLVTGGITATNSSDKRLKKNIRKFNASKVLMSLGGVYEYEYLDSEVQKNHIYEGLHYGLIYQHVKGTALDVMCHEREDGMGALNYIHPKFISLIAGATMENITEVEKLKRDIRHLKAKVKQLEQRS